MCLAVVVFIRSAGKAMFGDSIMAHKKMLQFFRIFSSHMVLQREREIVFSGRGEVNAEFRIAFAGDVRTGRVGADGIWSVAFPARNAGGPFILCAGYTGEADSIVFDDILVGEVWMCTGQSNMAMPVNSAQPFWRTANAEEELKHADHPRLRLYNSVPTQRLSPEKPCMDEAGTGWTPCSAENVESFSACGYFFGRRLQNDLQVPVGIIAAAWGGTNIEAWISPEKFKEKQFNPFPITPEESRAFWQKLVAGGRFDELKKWLIRFDAQGQADPAWLAAKFDDSNWEKSVNGSMLLPVPGRYVARLNFDLPEEAAAKEYILEFGIVNDMDRAFLNDEFLGATGVETPEYWGSIRKYRVPAERAKAGKNLIAVVADNHFGTGSVTVPVLIIHCGTQKWELPTEITRNTVFVLPDTFPPRPDIPAISNNMLPTSPNYPSTLFNGMLYPWFRYAVRGTIWYQGCNNNGQFTYYPLHSMLIDDLREHWRDPAMLFLLVQLAAYHEHHPEQPLDPDQVDALPFPEFSPYAVTREIQSEMPRVRAHVGMVVAFDRGNPSDIHPRDKQTLGTRLALKAESMLGWSDAIADGPEFAGIRQEGKTIRVFFRNTGSGLTTTDGKAPTGFVLGSRDGAFVRADAKIEGNTVVVSSEALFDPQRVRYAFTGFCKVNLVNREGFPALPFRSDKTDYRSMFAD